MRTRPFGNTGTDVSVIGLGVLPLCIEGRPNENDAVRVIHAALDAGVSWLDTADAYGLDETEVGYGERLAARALREWQGGRHTVRVATKAGFVRPGGRWVPCGRPAHLRAACEASLKALGIPRIFLLQLHTPDPRIPFADSVGALVDLQREGKIEHIGLSNVDAAQLRVARRVARIASVQNRCNLFERHSYANGVVDACERFGIAFIAHSPLGGFDGHSRTRSDPALQKVANRLGSSPYQVALAWLVESSPNTFVIPGARRIDSATSSANAGDVWLSAEDRAVLECAFPPASFFVKRAVAVRRELRHAARTARAALGARWAARRSAES